MVAVRKNRAWIAAACLCAAALAARTGRAAVQMQEDLSGCKLPNDVKTLAAPGTAEAKGGTLFRASTGTLGSFPVAADGKALTPDEAVRKIRDTRAGDLQFATEHDGSFWAFSGNISELGPMYLADAASKPLDVPLEIPKTSRNAAGFYPSIHEGWVYLVLTTEGRYMLVRVLEKTPSAVVIQYVYQPGAGLTFDIPHNQPVTYRPLGQPAAAGGNGSASAGAATAGGAAAADSPPAINPDIPVPPKPGPVELPRIATTLPPPGPPPALGPEDVVEPGRIVLRSGGPAVAGTVAGTGGGGVRASGAASTGTEPSLDAFLKTREQMIQKRLAIITAPTHSDADVDRKAQAIYELTYLQANEAADVLVAQIAFLDTHSAVKEFSPDALHPCFGALKRMGKAATAASIKGLKQLDLGAPGEGIDSAAYKADLLGRVVRAVEGNDVAEFIFHREMDHETDPRRRAVFDLLLSKGP